MLPGLRFGAAATYWEQHEQRVLLQATNASSDDHVLDSLVLNVSDSDEARDACTRLCEARRPDDCGSVVVEREDHHRHGFKCQLLPATEDVMAGLTARSAASLHSHRFDVFRRMAPAEIAPPPTAHGAQVSVALCITGVASHASVGKLEKPGLHARPIYDPRTFEGIHTWRHRLRQLGVRTDAFLVCAADARLTRLLTHRTSRTHALATVCLRSSHSMLNVVCGALPIPCVLHVCK